MLITEKWYKKEFIQSRADTTRATRIFADTTVLLFKEAEHINLSLNALEFHMHVLHEALGKLLQLHKDSNIDIGNLHLEMGGLKKDASHSFNIILGEVNYIKQELTLLIINWMSLRTLHIDLCIRLLRNLLQLFARMLSTLCRIFSLNINNMRSMKS